MEKYRIDSHKLIFHPERVSEWRKNGDCFPIYAEFGASGGCNHRCKFCAFDYIGYRPVILNFDVFAKNIKVMAENGLKSMLFSGEGEPFCNPDTPRMINAAKQAGVDVAAASNGVLFTPEKAAECLASLSWIRFSVNAGTPNSYASIHGTKPEDFGRALSNIADAVIIKRQKNLQAAIGVQSVLLSENKNEMISLCKRVREIGADYFTVKPYSQHNMSNNSIKEDYADIEELQNELESLSTAEFAVAFRTETMNAKGGKKSYSKCYGMPFAVHITAMGDVYGCSAFIGNDDWCFGNINEDDFADIWNGERRKKFMAVHHDISQCRELCRLDKINAYLEELTNPGAHVNFI